MTNAFIGVDGCRAGWIAVIRQAQEAPFTEIFARFSHLLAAFPQAYIAVDMPIGLPDRTGRGGRGPEAAARPLLGMRQSSVFSIPAREAVYTEEYAEACRIALASSDPPRKVSKQAFRLFPKIREIDRALTAGTRAIVKEVHPELAFWRLNGERAMALPKKVKSRIHPPGIEERRACLAANGLPRDFLDAAPPKGAATDDLFDACACALIAERIADGRARSFPERPARDAKGLEIAIWA